MPSRQTALLGQWAKLAKGYGMATTVIVFVLFSARLGLEPNVDEDPFLHRSKPSSCSCTFAKDCTVNRVVSVHSLLWDVCSADIVYVYTTACCGMSHVVRVRVGTSDPVVWEGETSAVIHKPKKGST